MVNNWAHTKKFIIFLVTLFRIGFFLSVAYLTVANLARPRISVRCQVSVMSQHLVRFHSFCWIIGGHTIHPPIEGLLLCSSKLWIHLCPSIPPSICNTVFSRLPLHKIAQMGHQHCRTFLKIGLLGFFEIAPDDRH